jgi:hypothetical protein
MNMISTKSTMAVGFFICSIFATRKEIDDASNKEFRLIFKERLKNFTC